MTNDKRHVGTIKWWNNTRGYGFIQRNGADDCFFHAKDLIGENFTEPIEGDHVSFQLVADNKGKNRVRAVEVKLIPT
jgi:CspA family cold shock protein